MKNRLLVGFGLIFAFLGAAWLDLAWLNFCIFVLLLFLAMRESTALYGLKENYIIWVALIFFSFSIFLNPIFAMVAMITAFAEALAYIKSDNPKLILPLIYPAAPIFLLYALLKECGMGCVVWLVICVALCDTAAFFTGKSISANNPSALKPLSASSPNKSLQGGIAGIIAGSIFGGIFAWAWLDIAFVGALGVSLFVSIFGVLGDLFESYLKRLAGVKDSGNILGDHGGVLDRFDAILFGAVAMLVVLA